MGTDLKDHYITLEAIRKAYENIRNVVLHTPSDLNQNLSAYFGSRIFLKREDLQIVRSYKIRGAYNKMVNLSDAERKKGVVCASAGNHAQGVAYSCHQLGIYGKIYMPNTTPSQKVKQVSMFGKDMVDVILMGDSFDAAYHEAIEDVRENNRIFIHPFDDPLIMAGQGTVGMEILNDVKEPIDYLFMPIGGGGLSSGVASYFKQISPGTKIIGVEPEGAPAMKRSIDAGQVIELDEIDKFVDGASVKRVGSQTFQICNDLLDDVVLVPEGKICTTILKLYNEEAMVVEPAGAMSIAALDFYREEIEGKNVVCVVSGGNNDITRTEEIKERSLIYEGLKHYFIIRFPQRAGALKEFLVNVLGPNDDIAHFEYTKKTNRDKGPALVGIEVPSREDYQVLLKRMQRFKINFTEINKRPDLFTLLI